MARYIVGLIAAVLTYAALTPIKRAPNYSLLWMFTLAPQASNGKRSARRSEARYLLDKELTYETCGDRRSITSGRTLTFRWNEPIDLPVQVSVINVDEFARRHGRGFRRVGARYPIGSWFIDPASGLGTAYIAALQARLRTGFDRVMIDGRRLLHHPR